MKNSYIKIGFLVIIPPIIIALILYKFRLNEDWLGYWGGIIGSGLGVFGAFLILKEQVDNDKDSLATQIQNEREQNRLQQIDNTFFNLLSMYNEQINVLKETNEFEGIYKHIKKELTTAKYKTCLSYLKNNQNMKIELNELIDQLNEKIKENEPNMGQSDFPYYKDYWIDRHEKLSFAWYNDPVLDQISEAIDAVLLIENILNNEMAGKNDPASKIYQKLSKLDDYIKELDLKKSTVYKREHEEFLKYSRKGFVIISEENRKQVVDSVLSQHYNKISSYFKLFHRIIKYLNVNLETNDEGSLKNNYIGFLRATLNPDEMLVIFYNAAYTSRGAGLLHELQKTTFFGTKTDIERNQHFERSDLFWEKEDISLMLNQNRQAEATDSAK
ncbi:putative phage abortive infection protein [Enterococcus casseliflavus]|uniref:putative phage abortive infection protein n=1 Tax=Enterococcus casseliflavus TaxID=37734 RepID=UPI00325BE2C8